MLNRIINLRLCQSLYQLFSHPETEYIAILKEYVRNSKATEEWINKLNKPAQKEVQKIIDKILLAVNLCPDNINLKS
jgi:exopolyphosphatase/pppGpp-phosphohydrolase